jgi:hypothetical protein
MPDPWRPSCWFGCYTYHETEIWITKDCGIALFALALLLYVVFRQRKLLIGPLVLGMLCLLFALWGQVSHEVLLELGRSHPSLSAVLPDKQQADTLQLGLTLFALVSTALLLAAGFMKVLAEWPGALFRHKDKGRTSSHQRGL